MSVAKNKHQTNLSSVGATR